MAGRSTDRPGPVQVGDIVLVTIDPGVLRPLLVTAAQWIPIYQAGAPPWPAAPAPDPTPHPPLDFRVSGLLCCEPPDILAPLFRGWSAEGADPARVTGRPDRLTPIVFAEALAEGTALGQWRRREE